MVKIKEIYAGKPDAKDEVEVGLSKYFLESYIEPINFDGESLIKGTNYFITGFKGTGKTALLFYLENCITKMDASSFSSFIFFKEDFPLTMRQEMEVASKRMTSIVSIGRDVLIDGNDFEALWRWLIYQRIWEDNIYCSERLFIKNDAWHKFDKLMKLVPPTVKRKLSIPKHLKLSMSITKGDTTFTPNAEIDFTARDVTETEPYRKLLKFINELDETVAQLERTNIPYYIFVDELEAYFGDEEVFKRDLRLIRDLIFTVKKLNIVFSNLGGATMKMICSIRREILNAINRYVVTKELNKVTSGFDVPMVWNYTNTNSFNHPILRILVKRIQMAEMQLGSSLSESEVVQKWFPENIDRSEPANYILNNSWNKPRDIVRLILSAQGCLCSEHSSFNQATFDMLRKNYSTESLNEIREELRALYSEKSINEIITCFTGYREYFSYNDLKKRIAENFANSILSTELDQILMDLYRLGFIGNYMPSRKSYRWLHKGDEQLLLGNEWFIIIHPALLSVLSIRKQRGDFDSLGLPPVNSEHTVSVRALSLEAIDVEMNYNGVIAKGRIHSQDLKYGINQYSIGSKLQAKIIGIKKKKCLMIEI